MTKSLETQLQELDEDSQIEFCNTSYRFLKSVSSHFGSDGEALVKEALRSVLGDEWINQLLIKKLSGEINLLPEFFKIHINSHVWDESVESGLSPKLNATKAFRKITGRGLKDSKDYIELAMDKGMVKVSIIQFMWANPEDLKEMAAGGLATELGHLLDECSLLIYQMKQYGVIGEIS